LPGGNTEIPEALLLQEETVRVDVDGVFYHNEESVSPDELQQHMQQLHQQTSANHTPLLVTLSTEPDTRYSEIVKALNVMNKAGVESITFETIAGE
jgi:biopolymer transport protein ExbD